ARPPDPAAAPGVAPGQGGGIALGENPELVAVDLDGIAAASLDLARIGAENRVVLQQMCQRGRVGQVVDRDPLDLTSILSRLGCTEHVPADPAEPVDSHP